MSKSKDLTGMRFGRLTVIGRAEKTDSNRNVYWNCQCDCGNIRAIPTISLIHGRSKSCGCSSYKHGMNGTKIYNVWHGIKKRCFDSNNTNYPRYGGRGITMYPDWIHDFQAFYDYVSQLEHYGEEGYSLDRIDNNGNYAPNNLRWADKKTQARNRCNNLLIEYNGNMLTFTEVAEKTGLKHSTLYNRIKRGDTGERLFRPVN